MPDFGEQFISLFEGQTDAHGVFIPEETIGKKVKGTTKTVREAVTLEKWSLHLEGKRGIGIVPINKDSKCKWAVIDVDDYDLDYISLLKKIEPYPFVCCKSKSGGAHLFLFLKDFQPAKLVREYIRSIVGTIGLGNSEIFPKQDTIMAERGDVGNWLNMPYFGEARPCIQLTGDGVIKELSKEEFIQFANFKSVDLPKMVEFEYEKSELKEAPPCLQILSLKGFPQNTRNKALFNVGVFLKKSEPTIWKNRIKYFNKLFFSNNGNEPLSERELETLIKSLDKKEYFYQCYEEPMCSFCNAKLCRTRRFGISNNTSIPIINSVTKIAGDISLWFLDVEGGRLELTTHELYENKQFIMKCMNILNIVPMRMTAEKWHTFLQNIVDQAIVIYDEQMFAKHEIPLLFRQYIKSRLSMHTDDIPQNRVYYKKEEMEVWFKFESFMQFVRYKKVDTSKAAILMWFKERGMRSSVTKNKDRQSIRHVAVKIDSWEQEEIESKIKEQEELM